MVRRILAGLGALAAPFGLAAPAGALIVIDRFVTEQALQLQPGSSDSWFESVAAPEAIGGERDAQITRTAGDDYADLLINYSGLDELLACSAAPGTAARWTVVWDGPDGGPGVDADGLGGRDLTEGGANEGFWIRVLSDLPATLKIAVTGASGGASEASLDLPGGDTWLVNRFLPFTEFAAPALLADVGSLSLELTGGTGLDAQIDHVKVPEPGGAAAAALCALLALARRHAARPRG